MTWISLASNRYKLREILKHNLGDAQREKLRFEVIDSLLGRYALLSGDEFYIKREVELAEFLLSNYIKKAAPPFHIVSDVMDLVIIADLGELDYTDIFFSIAKSRSYKQDVEKSLRLVARRIAGLEKIPIKHREKKGHIANEKNWLRMVEEYNPEQIFSLAVTLEHPRALLLKKFILPLAFLLAKNQPKEKRFSYLRQLLAWGAANIEEKKNVVYERTSAPPNIDTLLNAQGESYGFDAVELKEDEVIAYLYFGENSEIPRLFEQEKFTHLFFEKISDGWKTVENSVESDFWSRIKLLKANNKCRYVIVYDVENIKLPIKVVEKVSNQTRLDVVTKDITDV